MKLSKWNNHKNVYWERHIEGSDFKDVANRYAFIDMLGGMVRIEPFDYNSPGYDIINWLSENKYDDMESLKNWCDVQLLEMGHELL